MDLIFKTSTGFKFRNSEKTNVHTDYIKAYLDAYLDEIFSRDFIMVYENAGKMWAHELDWTKEAIAVYSGFSSDGMPALRIRCGKKDIKKWDLSHDIQLCSAAEFEAKKAEYKDNNGYTAERVIFEFFGVEYKKSNENHKENGDFGVYQIKFTDNSTIKIDSEKATALYNEYCM
jgi:hypothetical protein